MTAERWHEYHNNYRKYGFDMKPAVVKPTKETKGSTLTSKEKARVIFLILLTGVLCLGGIGAKAYTAYVEYEINTINRGNTVLTGEIESLNVKIENATNIRTIKEKAMAELGMGDPTTEQFIFLNPEAKPQGDFALLLREQAYN